MKEADSEEDSGVYGCRVGEVRSEVRVTVTEESRGTEEYPGGLDRETQEQRSSASSRASIHCSILFLISSFLYLVTLNGIDLVLKIQ